ncbi:hypothetical protein N9Y26_00355 [bacterium]|nr:hypothetical protein [bacterium]
MREVLEKEVFPNRDPQVPTYHDNCLHRHAPSKIKEESRTCHLLQKLHARNVPLRTIVAQMLEEIPNVEIFSDNSISKKKNDRRG